MSSLSSNHRWKGREVIQPAIFLLHWPSRWYLTRQRQHRARQMKSLFMIICFSSIGRTTAFCSMITDNLLPYSLRPTQSVGSGLTVANILEFDKKIELKFNLVSGAEKTFIQFVNGKWSEGKYGSNAILLPPFSPSNSQQIVNFHYNLSLN